MHTLIALLRAVNVGGTSKLPMAELRAMAEAEGFGAVRTYIRSGNLVFETDRGQDHVKTALETRLEAYAGRPVGVILRTAEEMSAILAANPFPDAERSKVGVLFLDAAPPPDTCDAAKWHADEEIALGTREVFVHYPSGMGRTKLRLPAMADGTMRNVNTVAKLADMVGRRE
ncbi:DUF1697 domain-containing protein [uncultured Jannaschia sp.]|uniref:DUF1697 domain-containing protein n=1 Tax=uncultured Jannaschia sp. TaxID=293347 RepID=UPI002616C9AD|nr:DUF1697 domain-containing protein [uncultured Jannaschia sp.]